MNDFEAIKEQTDITQLTRYEFLCVTDFDEDYTFACVDAPPEGEVSWYTVCGRPHTNFAAWMTGVAALGLEMVAKRAGHPGLGGDPHKSLARRQGQGDK